MKIINKYAVDTAHKYYHKETMEQVNYDFSVSQVASEIMNCLDTTFIPLKWKELCLLETTVNDALHIGREFHRWFKNRKDTYLNIVDKDKLNQLVPADSPDVDYEFVFLSDLFGKTIIGSCDAIIWGKKQITLIEVKTRSADMQNMTKYAKIQAQIYTHLLEKLMINSGYNLRNYEIKTLLIIFDVCDKNTVALTDVLDVSKDRQDILHYLQLWYNNRDKIAERKSYYIANNISKDTSLQELLIKKYLLTNDMAVKQTELNKVDKAIRQKCNNEKNGNAVFSCQYQNNILGMKKFHYYRNDYSSIKDVDVPKKLVTGWKFFVKSLDDDGKKNGKD